MTALQTRALPVTALALTLAVVAAAALLGWLDPAHPLPALLAVAVLALAWWCRRLAGDGTARREITRAIVVAALPLGAALAVAVGAHLGADDAAGLGARALGVLTGLIVAVFANVIPKQFGSARATALRRSAGWAGVLGGVGYAAAWCLVPLTQAPLVAGAVLLAACLVAAARLAWHAPKA